jgi:hypothetical protein
MKFAGGQEFILPTGIAFAANITPHKETGIGSWSKKQFVRKFKSYDDPSIIPHKVQPNQMNTSMPWFSYAGITEKDLGAIYEYIMSLEPIDKKVERFKTYSQVQREK